MIPAKTVSQENTFLVPVHEPETTKRTLDIVVPFTTLELTQAALDEADRLVRNLNVRIRVVAVQTVPIALNLNDPPVRTDHLEKTLRSLVSSALAHGEIYLVRDAQSTWAKLLRVRSLIVIASRKRFWRTRQESLAGMLERNGQEVVIIYPGTKKSSA